MAKIKVENTEITVSNVNGEDYICITDMLKAKDGDFFVTDWLRNRNTMEFLGVWERVYNPNFNYGEFATIRNQSGLNSFKISVKEFVARTGAISLQAKAGRYGGTYAHKDIAFEFAMWISPGFKVYVVREFQRLKADEQKQLAWSAKRELSKINYRIHTDAIKSHLIPAEVTREQAAMKYAPHTCRSDSRASSDEVCRGSRRAECGHVWHDCQAMARCQSETQGQHSRLCHHQRTYLSFKHGEHKCCAHQRRYASGRKAHKTQPDCHPTDAGAGG